MAAKRNTRAIEARLERYLQLGKLAGAVADEIRDALASPSVGADDLLQEQLNRIAYRVDKMGRLIGAGYTHCRDQLIAADTAE